MYLTFLHDYNKGNLQNFMEQIINDNDYLRYINQPDFLLRKPINRRLYRRLLKNVNQDFPVRQQDIKSIIKFKFNLKKFNLNSKLQQLAIDEKIYYQQNHSQIAWPFLDISPLKYKLFKSYYDYQLSLRNQYIVYQRPEEIIELVHQIGNIFNIDNPDFYKFQFLEIFSAQKMNFTAYHLWVNIVARKFIPTNFVTVSGNEYYNINHFKILISEYQELSDFFTKNFPDYSFIDHAMMNILKINNDYRIEYLDIYQWFAMFNYLNYPQLNMNEYYRWQKNIPKYKEIKKDINHLNFNNCYLKIIPYNTMTIKNFSKMQLEAENCLSQANTDINWYYDYFTHSNYNPLAHLYYQNNNFIYLPWLEKPKQLNLQDKFYSTNYTLPIISGFFLVTTLAYQTYQVISSYQKRKNNQISSTTSSLIQTL